MNNWIAGGILGNNETRAYHDRQRRCIHDDGENGGGKTAEQLPHVAVEGEEGHQGRGWEDREDESKEPENLSLLLLGRKDDEDQDVDWLDGGAGPVDGRYQEVVRRHERKPVPVHQTSSGIWYQYTNGRLSQYSDLNILEALDHYNLRQG